MSRSHLSRRCTSRFVAFFRILTVRLCCFEGFRLARSPTCIERFLRVHRIGSGEDLNNLPFRPYHKAIASREIKEWILHIVELHKLAFWIGHEDKPRPQAFFILFERLTIVA